MNETRREENDEGGFRVLYVPKTSLVSWGGRGMRGSVRGCGGMDESGECRLHNLIIINWKRSKGRYFKREMQRRIFMSSPELFISRACAKRYRARGRRSDLRDGRREGDAATAGTWKTRWRGGCRRDKAKRRGGTGGRQGKLKRGMKRQTAADEIHNLDPMRSLYLV